MRKEQHEGSFSNIRNDAEKRLLDYAKMLFADARAKRKEVDVRIDKRNQLYKGAFTNANDDTRGTAGQDILKNKCHRNMCFELIETQINNGIPQPKITPTKASKKFLAQTLEKWLRHEMDRIEGEQINDRVERGVLKQGTHFYTVGWDDSLHIGEKRGGLWVKEKPIQDVWPQPGVTDFNRLDYVFVRDIVSLRMLEKQTGFTDIPEMDDFFGLVDTITYWYYDEDGYVCRLVWVDNTDYILFNDQDYESRRVRVCSNCGRVTNADTCPDCGSEKFGYQSMRFETLTEDIVKGDPSDPNSKRVIAHKGDKIPYYALRRIPIVCRVNISDDNSMYGISDIDMLETNQETCNAVTSKIEQNILKAGSIVVLPSGVNVKMSNETLKVVRVKDPKMAQAIDVKNLQASIQQDDILAERAYQYGRASLGITDSYQGKRDPTAESGKAKEIAAAQSAGRLESKRRMKDAAYADLYYMMFQMFLAYDDVKERIINNEENGDITSARISRYDFLDEYDGTVYYDDSFLFDVDTASVLYTSRESLWQETTANFQAGTMGMPQDPSTLMLYWSVMAELNYPLANKCLDHITKVLQSQQQMMQEQAAMQQAQAEEEKMKQMQEKQQTQEEPTTQEQSQPTTKNNERMRAAEDQMAKLFSLK